MLGILNKEITQPQEVGELPYINQDLIRPLHPRVMLSHASVLFIRQMLWNGNAVSTVHRYLSVKITNVIARIFSPEELQVLLVPSYIRKTHLTSVNLKEKPVCQFIYIKQCRYTKKIMLTKKN